MVTYMGTSLFKLLTNSFLNIFNVKKWPIVWMGHQGMGWRSVPTMPCDEWSACEYVSKVYLANNKYTRYTFALPEPYKVDE